MPSAQWYIMDDVLRVIYPACLPCEYLITVPLLHKEKTYGRFIHLFISLLRSSPCWKGLLSTPISFSCMVYKCQMIFSCTDNDRNCLWTCPTECWSQKGDIHYTFICLRESSRSLELQKEGQEKCKSCPSFQKQERHGIKNTWNVSQYVHMPLKA